MTAPLPAKDRHGMALVRDHGMRVALEGLEKSYGALPVLRGVDVGFEPGRTTALIGPNAAGKTTLLKCILGLVRPDRGRILVGGEVVGNDESYRRHIGYAPQAPSFPEHLTAGEITRLLVGLRGPGVALDNALFDAFELGPVLGQPVRTLSGGTRQKLNAALAFLFRPAVVILDEPTAGLDPIAAGALKEKISAAKQAGAAVIVTSHVTAELEELADDVVLLLDGNVRYAGSLARIGQETGECRLERAIAGLMRTSRMPR
jgi:Cu-processing system ATP-binding protein